MTTTTEPVAIASRRPAPLDYASLAARAANEIRQSPAARLASLDAFRGIVMILMVSAGLRMTQVVAALKKTPQQWRTLPTRLLERIAYHTDHATWAGCTLWDLIQPSFMFMVGVAMVFSLASR